MDVRKECYDELERIDALVWDDPRRAHVQVYYGEPDEDGYRDYKWESNPLLAEAEAETKALILAALDRLMLHGKIAGMEEAMDRADCEKSAGEWYAACERRQSELIREL